MDGLISRGFMYVAYGERARREAAQSIGTLRQWHSERVIVLSDADMPGTETISVKPTDKKARSVKTALNLHTPFAATVYIDADTRIHGDLSFLFRAVEAGWDLVIAVALHQGSACLSHVQAEERTATFEQIGGVPVHLQGGMLAFGRGAFPFFEAWRQEWARWKDEDQAALLRALDKSPCRVLVVSRDWNGGSVVEHRYGELRR